jgi:hypothetical protein
VFDHAACDDGLIAIDKTANRWYIWPLEVSGIVGAEASLLIPLEGLSTLDFLLLVFVV